ncbi:MAG: outer membrane lipoprotein carrier protein LolA [Myxococcales bacterium]|nr:outer membrane lipoprotein carrier protein LolA [Myxococcales bacterium]
MPHRPASPCTLLASLGMTALLVVSPAFAAKKPARPAKTKPAPTLMEPATQAPALPPAPAPLPTMGQPAAPVGSTPAIAATKAAAGPLAPADVAARVQVFYEKQPGFAAQFTQVVKKMGMPKGIERSGSMWLQKGDAKAGRAGKMRWDYPNEEIFYFSDGEVLWSYERRERLAVRVPVQQSQLYEATSWLMGAGQLAKDFTLALVPSPLPDAWALELTPKGGQQVMRTLTLVVDKATGAVRGTVLVDPLGDSTTLLWRDPKHEAIADTVFQWSPPAGVQVKDLAKGAGSR